MPLTTALAGGVGVLVAIIVFVALMYRVVGVRPGPAERRRLRVQLVGVGTIILLLAVLSAMKVPGAELYGLGLAAVAFFGARILQQRGHWLVTLTAEEQAEFPARRAAFAAARGRLLLLGAGFVLTVPLLGLAIVILTR